MDVTRAITYDSSDLNDAAAQLGKPGLVGCSVESVSMGDIQPLQYMDKMYQQQGMDFQGVGNLMVATRTIEMTGVLYGDSRRDLWDRLDVLRNVLDPVQAYRADQDTVGFLPLAWQEPTGDSGAVVDRLVYARSGGLKTPINRDKQGSNVKTAPTGDQTFYADADDNALALQWSCQFICRDPRVYGIAHSLVVTPSASGTLTNAGDYPTLADLTLIVGSGEGTIDVEVGGTFFTIAVEVGYVGSRTIRYRGWTKLLTLEDSHLHATEEILRMDMLVFDTPDSDTQHPSIQPGASAYHVTPSTHVTIKAGSVIEYKDAYA